MVDSKLKIDEATVSMESSESRKIRTRLSNLLHKDLMDGIKSIILAGRTKIDNTITTQINM